ncbi:NERD domain-containing protein [Aquibacillus sp. 3ASR75-11]|uniref:NERD domain-containing protein n=1 Tax=Terrihalobacillus insolitus TaxID=2950438 RepID=A0A9X3WSE0_9BACI|nr:NERD domain-containing protein [Terrihalobacillus insolitus]MDC3413123.1 NERD domain-containing protein [Terrihalobacillus insolitus]MDC3424865.1 NERD domain-containing protein [Terrihalobacillus insolitus]
MFYLVILVILIILFKLNFAKIKGAVGESYVKNKLEKLEPDNYTVFNDLYVPTKEGTTQVDHIVTAPYGVFVIETKHYDGWIFGSENQRYWTQVIYKRKEKIFNPIWQNGGHIQALSDYLNLDKSEFHSIIAFSGQSTFKFKEPFKQATVIHFNQLINTIRRQTNRRLNDIELHAINKKIEQLAITDKKQLKQVKKEHLKLVKEKKTNKNKTSSTKKGTVQQSARNTKRVSSKVHNIQSTSQTNGSDSISKTCPKCGEDMVEKRGKYGRFLGCKNYPSCKYTVKSS